MDEVDEVEPEEETDVQEEQEEVEDWGEGVSTVMKNGLTAPPHLLVEDDDADLDGDLAATLEGALTVTLDEGAQAAHKRLTSGTLSSNCL